MKNLRFLNLSSTLIIGLFIGLSACVSDGSNAEARANSEAYIDTDSQTPADERARMLARFEAELAEIEAQNNGQDSAPQKITNRSNMPEEAEADFDDVLFELNALASQDETALEVMAPYELSQAERDIIENMADDGENEPEIEAMIMAEAHPETAMLEALPVEEIAPIETRSALLEELQTQPLPAPAPIVETEAHQTQLLHDFEIDLGEETTPRELTPLDFLEPSHLEEDMPHISGGNVLPTHNFTIAPEDSTPHVLEGTNHSNQPRAGFEGDVNLDAEIYESPFTDIPNNHELAEAANYLYDIGIIGGYADGSFRPTSALSRASAIKFILLLSGEVISARQNDGLYRDLPDGQWFTPYMLTAIEEGYVRVPANRLLRPGETIILREFMDIFAHAINPTGSQNAQASYDDQELTALANRYGMFSSTNISTDLLTIPLNRGQVLSALYSFMSVPQVHYIGVRHGRYGAARAEAGTGRCYRPFGTVQVTVRASAKPVTLALAAHEPTIWQIEAEAGARIERIFLSGYHIQRITGVSDNIPVNRNFYYEIVPHDQGDRHWFYNRNTPEDGYFTGECSESDYRTDGATEIPNAQHRQNFSVRSGGEYYATYRDRAACDNDQFCRQQLTRDIETFNRLTGMEFSNFQGAYTGTHFVIDPQ